MSDKLSFKAQVLSRMRADQSLRALLPVSPDESIFPNARAELNSTTTAPFITVVVNDLTNVDDIVETVSVEFWVYDEPRKSYWEIDRILRTLHKIFNGWRVGLTYEGVLDELMREYVSGEFTDDDLAKVVKYSRYRTWLVA